MSDEDEISSAEGHDEFSTDTTGDEQTLSDAENIEELFKNEDEEVKDIEGHFKDDFEKQIGKDKEIEAGGHDEFSTDTEDTTGDEKTLSDAENVEELFKSEDEEVDVEGHFEDDYEKQIGKDKENENAKQRRRSKHAYRLRNVFARPRYAEPRHPIFSSPFARRISARAFGPKKPMWYTPLTSAQLYLFKDIMNYVEIGREGVFRLDDFLEALQDFDPSITEQEVVRILDSMERSEFEELDFGKFLFVLAFRDQAASIRDEDHIDKLLLSPVVTPRQCLILSAISYYVLIASPEEVERYYIANSRRKATVLHYHMEASRLGGLTERQMEKKQKKAMEHLGPLFAVTGSPYALPVPFVPSFQKTKLYEEMKGLSKVTPQPKKAVKRPIVPIKGRKLGERVRYTSKEDKTFYDMHYGRLPMPVLRIPNETRKEIRKQCTVEHKDYITRKAYEAKDKYLDRLKKATVLYNNRSLDIILKKGFPSEAEKKAFIEIFEKYLPLKLEDVKNFSLWVKPSGYQMAHTGIPLYPDKFAFGSKIP